MPVSCTAQDLVTAARCFLLQNRSLDAIEIYLLCAVAGGEVPPTDQIMLGNPDEDWVFGDPNAGIIFGIP